MYLYMRMIFHVFNPILCMPFYNLKAGRAAGASVSVQCAYRSPLARGLWISLFFRSGYCESAFVPRMTQVCKLQNLTIANLMN